MRNIIEYPITVEEKIGALETAIQRFLEDEAVGGIEAAALSEVLSDVRRQATPFAGVHPREWVL